MQGPKGRVTAMERDVERVLVSEEEIGQICDEMAARISAQYTDEKRTLIVIVILKGSMMFAADLCKRIKRPCELEFMKVSSYGATTESAGFIQVQLDLKRDVADADVLIVEDIVDSGRTLEKLTALLSSRGAHSVACCALLDKPDRRQVDFSADFVGRQIPDLFVVGYGLDYDERYRNLPYVGVLKPSVYQK